ncbi:MAG: hypothetical protein IT356_00565 [Gemmatimonadaceae bacterium]|nr:hypothetical protein [Gemmatimonadaceae bacterium]
MTTPVIERISPANVAWLKEFSVAMHRRFAYPPGHPSSVAAGKVAVRALEQALVVAPEIVMTIGRRHLSIGGAVSDPRNPALGELAERLHRQGIAAITLREGLGEADFDALLGFIVTSHAPESEDDDLTTPRLGEHVSVELLSYDGLVLDEEEEDGPGHDEKAEHLWQQLAEAALIGWDDGGGTGKGGGGGAASDTREENGGPASEPAPEPSGAAGKQPAAGDAAPADAPPATRRSGSLRRSAQLSAVFSAEQIAAAISARARADGDRPAILKSLLRIGRHVRRRGRGGSGAVAARLREVLEKLEPGTLAKLLEGEPDPARQRLLLIQGVDSLPVSAVTDWIEAAATSGGKTVSSHLLLLFKKLAAQTHRRADSGADEGGEPIREAARKLIDDWTFEAGGSDAHGALLAKIGAYDSPDTQKDGGGGAGADVIVQIALETNVSGPDVGVAVSQLIDEKRLGLLFRFLDEAERASVAAPMIAEQLLEPEMVRLVMLAEPIETEGARLLLERCELPQADALLDALAISESEATRRLLLARLGELGDSVRDKLIARLDGATWYVQRNLLMLLAALPDPPQDLPFDSFTASEEPMLRLEAYRLLAKIPARREKAVHDALSDPDQRVVRGGIELAADGVGRRSHARLLQLVEEAAEGSDIRIRGIALLVHVSLPASRDWLLAHVRRRRGFLVFRRWALVPRSPEMLAALRVLAQRWPADPDARATLALAAGSGDQHLAAAAAGREAK